jgi:hypothetical protein
MKTGIKTYGVAMALLGLAVPVLAQARVLPRARQRLQVRRQQHNRRRRVGQHRAETRACPAQPICACCTLSPTGLRWMYL